MPVQCGAGAEILPNLQASLLLFHSCSHRTRDSWVRDSRDFIPLAKSRGQGSLFAYAGSPYFPSPAVTTTRPRDGRLHGSGLCYGRGTNPELRGFTTNTATGGELALGPGERAPHPLRPLAANTTLRNCLGNEQPGPGTLGVPYISVQRRSGPTAHLSQQGLTYSSNKPIPLFSVTFGGPGTELDVRMQPAVTKSPA